MASSGPGDGGEKERALSENVLLVDTMDLQPAQLTVGDIVDSNKEGAVETDQIRRLEKRHSRGHSRHESWTDSLLPRIPDVFLENLEENEKEIDVDDCQNPDLQNSPSTLSDLAMHLSTRNLATNKDQEAKLESRDARNPELKQDIASVHTLYTSVTNPPTLSDLNEEYARLAAPEEEQEASRRFSVVDDAAAKTVADLYYENAAKMIVSDDIESGRESSCRSNDSSRKQKIFEILKLKRRAAANLEGFKEFVQPHKKRLRKSFKMIMTYIMLPSLFMSIILFYAFDNPPNGYALIPCPNATITLESNRKLQASLSEAMGKIKHPFPIGKPLHKQTPKPKETTSSPTLSPTMLPPANLKEAVGRFKSPLQLGKFRDYSLSDRREFDLCVDKSKSTEEASVSWWFLFVGVRQAVTFCLALLMELLVIDFFMFRTRFFPKLIGTKLALAVAQSKGWPCILFFWALWDILLLYGGSRLARHWLFYQNIFALLNETNPSGGIPGNGRYKTVIHFAIGLSIATTLKRTMMANFVGQRVVVNYRLDLMKLVKKLLIVGDIANLSKAKQMQSNTKSILFQRMSSLGRDVMGSLEDCRFGLKDDSDEDDDSNDSSAEKAEPSNSNRLKWKSSRSPSPTTDHNSFIFINQVYDNLDEWEEPELQATIQRVSTKEVLHFRRAVEFISGDYPFSPAFGKATTREECARASQNLFEKLLERDKEVLNFDVLCKVARNSNGKINRRKIFELVKLFRPNRNGEITKVEFVKSIDSTYKRLRLVLANINNASQIDRAYGQITNIVFYAVVLLVALSVFGFDVMYLIITIAGLLVSFAFMIGSASAKYIEGILLILVRKPYDIGDKVCFLDANADVDDVGPPGGGWIVENVDLYTTRVRQGTTREYATFTNGSLANSRIINLKRSEKPNIYMYLKFTMDITQEQLNEFRRRIDDFIKERPREWIKLVSLRCTHFETDQQYLKFTLIVQHRESWQSFGTIQVSKSDIYIHALHLQKELKMDYNAPKVPVHLTESPPASQNSSQTVKPKLQGTFHNSAFDANNVHSTETSSSTIQAGVSNSVDGSLFRRKAIRNESKPPLDRRQVSFARLESQDDAKKNKDK